MPVRRKKSKTTRRRAKTDGLKVRRVALTKLHLDPANSRKHNKRNLATIRGSLKRFGQVEPLVVQRGTGRVIGGNGRLEVMLASGETHADVIEIDASDMKAAALAIALNRTAELAEWDTDILAAVAPTLGTDLLSDIGFDANELDKVLGGGGWRKGEGGVVKDSAEAREFFAMPKWLAPIWGKATHVVVIYSGGRDSTAAALWAHHHRGPRGIHLCFSDTGVEFPGMGGHIASVAEFLDVDFEITKPSKEWWSWLKKEGRWPSMLWPKCQIEFVYKPTSRYAKKYSAEETVIITGTHGAEAIRGSKKTENSELYGLRGYRHFAPCFDATKMSIAKIVEDSGVPVWGGYTRGFARTACWCCPKQQGLQAAALAENYPGLAEDIRTWEERLGPMQPESCPGGKSFDDLVATGRRKRQREAKKSRG